MTIKPGELSAGTTEPDPEGAAAGSGTPESGAAGGNHESLEKELANLRQQQTEWLKGKSKVEAANEVLRENEELKRRLSEAAPPNGSRAASPEQLASQEYQGHMNTLRQAAAAGDAYSIMLLTNIEATQMTRAQAALELELLQTIPDKDKRDKVRAEVLNGRAATPAIALDALDAPSLREELKREREKSAEYEKLAADRARGRIGPGAPIPITARQLADGVSEADFNQERQRLRDAGMHREARELTQKKIRGEIKVSPD